MSLTPADIHNTEFTRASLGRRGYDENDVDALLDEATAEMIRLLEENDTLRGSLDAAPPPVEPDGRRREVEAELSAATAALNRAHQARDRAEREAGHLRQQLQEAHRAAAAPVKAAPVKEVVPERVLMMARNTAEAYVREAQDKSRELLTEARERAGRTLREAGEAVATIDRKAHERENEAVAELTAGRARLVREIDEMSRFAADYQGAMERHLHRQAQLIDGTTTD